MSPAQKMQWATLTVRSDSDPSLNTGPLHVDTAKHRIGRVPGRNETVVKSSVVSTSHCTITTAWEVDEAASKEKDNEAESKDGDGGGGDGVLLKAYVMDHSTNGTFVDGERLPRKKKVEIKNGARIVLSKGTPKVAATSITLQLVRVPRDRLHDYDDAGGKKSTSGMNSYGRQRSF
jgi:pSer/pThr/pTyr-binding forkhead associated (FHA) protein